MEKMTKPNNFSFEEIEVGRKFTFEHLFTEKDILEYAELIGDFNPMHIDSSYAEQTQYEGVISHGMLGASLFSTFLGMYCPGKDSIILSLNSKFKNPIRPNKRLLVSGEVVKKTDALKMLDVKLTLSCDEMILIQADAKAQKL